jgi:uncharacterized membrane protein YkvA (DUF1232 family)
MLLLLTILAILNMKNSKNDSKKIDFAVVWDGIKSFARKAGRTAARPVLLLWFVMRSDSTPRKDKLLILAAIAYVVLPIDLISAKRIPILGWIDEVTSIAVAIRKMSDRITPAIEREADAVLDRWFVEYTDYVEIEG